MTFKAPNISTDSYEGHKSICGKFRSNIKHYFGRKENANPDFLKVIEIGLKSAENYF